MGSVTSIDPRTAAVVEVVAEETTPERLAEICAAVAATAPSLAALSPHVRSKLLDAMAEGLEADRDELVMLADRESALGRVRTDSELTRTINQLKLFAAVLRDGGYLEAIIDTATAATPDLRRMLVPLGPVAVFGASNFPFAFSAAGGDTASALAAGNPVVVKAHGAHPALDTAVVAVLRAAAIRQGMSPDLVAVVYGRSAARELVQNPLIQAVGFTGSESVGRMLMDLAAARARPIPVYAEMGSLNPLIVSPEAVKREGIAKTIADSILLGAGQFCTKPGVVLLPAGAEGDTVVRNIASDLAAAEERYLLSTGIRDSFVENAARVAAARTATAHLRPRSGEGSAVTPALSEVAGRDLSGETDLLVETFGPGALVVRYDSADELRDALRVVPPSLTVSLFAEAGEGAFSRDVVSTVETRTGRLIFDGVPTGVAVSWAQNHAGPYPASAGGMYTSVGATAIRRFQRPVAYQGFPPSMLPDALRDENPLGIPRRVDGRLHLSPR